MKTLSILLATLAIISCGDDEKEQAVLATPFEFTVTDISGKDLLDPKNSDAFKESEIKLFYLIDGNVQEVYDLNKDYPRNFLIYRRENSYRIRVFLNQSQTEGISKTLIQWKESDVDVFSAKFITSETSVIVESVWLNEKLIWTASENTEPFFALTK